MRKREFMRELSRRLDNLPAKEKENVMNYYDELIEDTIERTGRNEEDVIYDLGSINDIVRKVSYGTNKIKYEETSTEDDTVEVVPDDEKKTKETKNYNTTSNKSDNSIILRVLLLIITFPLWIGLVTGLFGCIVGFGAAGFGVGIAGLVVSIQGFCAIPAGLTYALFQAGIGIVMIGVAFIITPLLIKFVAWLIKLLGKFIKWLVGSESKKGANA